MANTSRGQLLICQRLYLKESINIYIIILKFEISLRISRRHLTRFGVLISFTKWKFIVFLDELLHCVSLSFQMPKWKLSWTRTLSNLFVLNQVYTRALSFDRHCFSCFIKYIRHIIRYQLCIYADCSYSNLTIVCLIGSIILILAVHLKNDVQSTLKWDNVWLVKCNASKTDFSLLLVWENQFFYHFLLHIWF